MVTRNCVEALRALAEAGRVAGVTTEGASLIRDGVNVMYRLPGPRVARVGPAGSYATAVREVAVSTWLRRERLGVVDALPDVTQAVVVDHRPVTWWRPLPPHRPAEPGELAGVLRVVHALAPPADLRLPQHEPFARLESRLADAPGVTGDDRRWLFTHLEDLRERYAREVPRQQHVIHGDAWQGNVVAPDDGAPIVADLETVSIGHRDWDLVQIAADHTDFARLSPGEYREFVDAYGGYDVVNAPWFRLFADIQELRWTAFAVSKATSDARVAIEARHRIACLRGDVPRPWTWSAI